MSVVEKSADTEVKTRRMGQVKMTRRLGDWHQPYSNAVELHDVWKSYATPTKKVEVLKGVNLTVQRGEIYGLLGPSGCGKTTLLRLIIGRLAFDKGSVEVFGDVPGDRCLGIPGVKLGYMPQDVALHNEFTIEETMYYFGRIHNMTSKNIDKRVKFLIELLHLPKESSFVKNLSGGQKRRVSFAAALLQEPPLLILDEPTVGVDPLLRQNIWNHLVTLVQESQTSVIITTHYIEEARQADVVGLMLGGRILIEDIPDNLLTTYGSTSLEDVFLKLCVGDKLLDLSTNEEEVEYDMCQANKQPATLLCLHKHRFKDITEEQKPLITKPTKKSLCSLFSTNKAKAIIIINLIRMWRNVGTMVFQFVVPSIQIIFFCLAVGHIPMGLDVGVVNFDNYSLAYGKVYTHAINDNSVILHSYDDVESAVEAINSNKIWGFVYIPSNFSQNLLRRLYECVTAEDEVLEGSKIRVWIDSTNQQILHALQKEFMEAMQKFLHIILKKNKRNPSVADIPLSIEAKVYGRWEVASTPSFTEYLAPGIILLTAFFTASTLTALTFLLERKDGLLDRMYAAGVGSLEILLGHFISSFLMMLVQNGLSLFCIFVLFGMSCRGSPFWIFVLIILQGSCGMFYGLLISTIFEEGHSAVMFLVASVQPALMLSGILWPLEGMPVYLRYISYGFPQTLPAKALRAMLTRGWDMSYMPVWRGFVFSLCWLSGLMISILLVMKLRR